MLHRRPANASETAALVEADYVAALARGRPRKRQRRAALQRLEGTAPADISRSGAGRRVGHARSPTGQQTR